MSNYATRRNALVGLRQSAYAERMMTFGERLLQTRQRRALTQQNLAQIAGVHASSISAWELGEGSQFPRTDLVAALAGALKVDPGWLAFGPKSERAKARSSKVSKVAQVAR